MEWVADLKRLCFRNSLVALLWDNYSVDRKPLLKQIAAEFVFAIWNINMNAQINGV